MEISTADVINAAVAKALSEINTEDLASVLVDHLNEHPTGSGGYGKSTQTRLEQMVDNVTTQLAQEVVREVVDGHKEEMRAKLLGMLQDKDVTVTLNTDYNKLQFNLTL